MVNTITGDGKKDGKIESKKKYIFTI